MTSREILEARAHRLARRVDSEASAKTTAQMLGFTVGRERYAVGSRFVFAAVQLVDLVRLPGATAPVLGVTRWRGDILTVLDVRRAVGGLPSALDDLGRVIVIGESAPEFGILADTIDGLASFDPHDVHPVSANRQLGIPGLVAGVTSGGVHLLDAKILIAHQSASVAPPLVASSSSSASQ
ncbi:MAG: chemotaxis protein CheW [bacterium]